MTQNQTDKVEMKCCFSYPGTFNHECGKPAIMVFVKPSTSTKSGEFYSGRCEECAVAKAGRDNQGVIRRESVNGQTNEWL